MSDKQHMVFLCFGCGLAIFFAGFLTGAHVMQNEAIAHGLAEWRIDKDHNITFY